MALVLLAPVGLFWAEPFPCPFSVPPTHTLPPPMRRDPENKACMVRQALQSGYVSILIAISFVEVKPLTQFPQGLVLEEKVPWGQGEKSVNHCLVLKRS